MPTAARGERESLGSATKARSMVVVASIEGGRHLFSLSCLDNRFSGTFWCDLIGTGADEAVDVDIDEVTAGSSLDARNGFTLDFRRLWSGLEGSTRHKQLRDSTTLRR
jgi:hypothetical protein